MCVHCTNPCLARPAPFDPLFKEQLNSLFSCITFPAQSSELSLGWLGAASELLTSLSAGHRTVFDGSSSQPTLCAWKQKDWQHPPSRAPSCSVPMTHGSSLGPNTSRCPLISCSPQHSQQSNPTGSNRAIFCYTRHHKPGRHPRIVWSDLLE